MATFQLALSFPPRVNCFDNVLQQFRKLKIYFCCTHRWNLNSNSLRSYKNRKLGALEGCEGSEVKSTRCSLRGHRVASLAPRWLSTTIVTPVQGIPFPHLASAGTACTWCTDGQTDKTLIHLKIKLEKKLKTENWQKCGLGP